MSIKFHSTVEVVKATKNSEIPTLGQVKDLINKFNKETVRVSTNGELSGTYIDDTLTLNTGITKIDGITLVGGDSILLKDQLDTSQNGVYIVSDLGTSSTALPQETLSNPGTSTGVLIPDVSKYEAKYTVSQTFTYSSTDSGWKDESGTVITDLSTVGITFSTDGTLTDGDTIVVTYTPGNGAVLVRREDFKEGTVIMNNTTVPVSEGSDNGDTKWVIVSDGVLTVGTSNLVFIKDGSNENNVKTSTGTFTGDGATTDFEVPHNFNLSDPYAYNVTIRDNAGNTIYVDNAPTIGKEANSITLKFAVAPESTESFKIYILALE